MRQRLQLRERGCQLHRGGLPGTVDSVRATQGANLLKEGDRWILQVGGKAAPVRVRASRLRS